MWWRPVKEGHFSVFCQLPKARLNVIYIRFLSDGYHRQY